MKTTIELEGIASKVYDDEGVICDIDVDGLQILDYLSKFMSNGYGDKWTVVKLKIEVEEKC